MDQKRRRVGFFEILALAFGSLVLLGTGEGPAEAPAGPGEGAVPGEKSSRALRGDWYVLIHARDSRGGDQAEIEWEDQVWRIESVGENLRWTLFPHVAFKRGHGRYQEHPDGLISRSRGTWQPDAQQLKEIVEGLEMDSYGARSKILRGSDAQGWSSAGSLRSGSTSMLGYHELWRIDLRATGPVFERQESMGSGRTDRLKAHTVLTSVALGPAGNEIVGEYASGERFRGRFRMIRMGVRGVPESDT